MHAPLMSISWRRGQDTPAPTAPSQPAATALAEHLAHFWEMDQHRPFSAPETRLFCYWLHKFHTAGWPTSLPGREQLVAAQLSMSVRVLGLALAGLTDRGLLALMPALDGSAPRWELPANRLRAIYTEPSYQPPA